MSKKYLIEFPLSYESEKMQVKKGEIIYSNYRETGSYRFEVIHFDSLDELKAIITERYYFDYFDMLDETTLYMSRTVDARDMNATEADFEAFNAGKICLFLESLQIDLNDIYTREKAENMPYIIKRSLESAEQINA